MRITTFPFSKSDNSCSEILELKGNANKDEPKIKAVGTGVANLTVEYWDTNTDNNPLKDTIKVYVRPKLTHNSVEYTEKENTIKDPIEKIKSKNIIKQMYDLLITRKGKPRYSELFEKSDNFELSEKHK